MKILSRFIALFYASLIGLLLLQDGGVMVIELIIVVMYGVTVLALLGLGGKFVWILGSITNCVFTFLCLILLFRHISGENVSVFRDVHLQPLDIFLLTLFVVLGLLTFVCLYTDREEKPQAH